MNQNELQELRRYQNDFANHAEHMLNACKVPAPIIVPLKSIVRAITTIADFYLDLNQGQNIDPGFIDKAEQFSLQSQSINQPQRQQQQQQQQSFNSYQQKKVQNRPDVTGQPQGLLERELKSSYPGREEEILNKITSYTSNKGKSVVVTLGQPESTPSFSKVSIAEMSDKWAKVALFKLDCFKLGDAVANYFANQKIQSGVDPVQARQYGDIDSKNWLEQNTAGQSKDGSRTYEGKKEWTDIYFDPDRDNSGWMYSKLKKAFEAMSVGAVQQQQSDHMNTPDNNDFGDAPF